MGHMNFPPGFLWWVRVSSAWYAIKETTLAYLKGFISGNGNEVEGQGGREARREVQREEHAGEKHQLQEDA